MNRILSKLLVVAAFLVMAPALWAACGSSLCVQANRGNTNPGTSVNVAFMSNQTAGNLNIVAIHFCDHTTCNQDTTAVTISVTDTATNSYQLAVNNVIDVNRRVALYYAENIAGGANTVTVSLTGCSASECDYLEASISEWSGIATSMSLDQTGTANTTGTPATVSTTGATTQNDELVYAFAAIYTTADLTAGTGYTEVMSIAGQYFAEYKTVDATGVQTATWGLTSQQYTAVIATFKEAAAGGATRQPCCLLGVF